MSDKPYYVIESIPSPAYANEKKPKDYAWISISLIVLLMHAGLPLLTDFSAPPPKKPSRQKVLVQTIALASPRPSSMPVELIAQADQTQIKPTPSPVQEKVEILPLPPLEKIEPNPLPPVPKEEPISEPSKPEPQEEPVKLEPKEIVEAPPPPPPPPPPPTPPAPTLPTPPVIIEPKKEPLPAAPKKPPVPKPVPPPEQKKPTPVKKPVVAPVKKPVEVPVKANAEKLAALEAEKKQQQELKAKQESEKKQKELAAREVEKKRQEELAKKEAVRKRQLEIEAEVERKRQEEIATVERARCQSLLAKANENLAKNKESRDKYSSTPGLDIQNTTMPTIIGSLQIDTLPADGETMAKWSPKEVSYRDEVAQILHGSLRLPEFGSIKIELTINKGGKVEKMKIISSESSKNKQYIEQKVTGLQFPAFGNRFQESAQCTFSVTLNNERTKT